MSDSAAITSAPTRPLEYLPVALFGSCMGLSALSIAWQLGHARFGFQNGLLRGSACLR